MGNGQLASRLVDLLDRALGQLGVGFGRGTRPAVMCIVIGLCERSGAPPPSKARSAVVMRVFFMMGFSKGSNSV